MTPGQATAIAPANIAFIKYWGVRDPDLVLPLNGSISMCLDRCLTETSVQFDSRLNADEVLLSLDGGDERPATGRAYERVVLHLDRLRSLAGVETRARVRSRNNFPTAAGIASSASAFSALTLAAVTALGLNLNERELSRLTRLSGSGSACRSIPDGYVEWIDDGSDLGSYAVSIAPAEHWLLADLVAVVETEEKRVASESGHRTAASSAYLPARLAEIPQRLADVRRGILERNLTQLGEAMEADAVSMHVVAMTATPPAFYWGPGTMAVIRAVHHMREAGLPCYFTIDAGANVHVICEAQQADKVQAELRELPEVRQILVNLPGPGARVTQAQP